MFFIFYLWGIVFLVVIFLGMEVYKKIKKRADGKVKYHYFIIVKNGQGMIEWLLRSIHFDSWVKGKNIKISVFDIGSSDESIEILNMLAYNNKYIDYLYTFQPNIYQIIGSKVTESENNGEKKIILYIFPQDKRANVVVIEDINDLKGEIS